MSTSVRADILLKISSDLAELRNTQAELGKTSMSLGDLAKAGGVAGAAFSAVTASLQGMQSMMRTFITDGVKFNATLETAKLGVASVLKQFDPQKYANFNDAIKDSSTVIASLKHEALTTAATFEELLVAYQGTAGAMQASGIPLGKQVTLIANISQAMSALGIRTEEMRQEATALLMGNIDRNARLAQTLGITSEQIHAAKEQGKLYEFITGRLGAFAEAGKIAADTINVLESNLKDASTQVAADNTKELTEAYRDLLKALTELVKSDGFGAVMKFMSALLSESVDKVKLVTEAFTMNDPNNQRSADVRNTTNDVMGAQSPGELNRVLNETKVKLLASRKELRDNREPKWNEDLEAYEMLSDEERKTIIANISAYEKIIQILKSSSSEIIDEVNQRANKSAEVEAEARKLNAAKLVTAELEKQAGEVEKKLVQSRYDLATDAQRLNILNDEGKAAIALYEKRMEAAALTKNDNAGNQAQLALSLALLDIEEKRRKVKKGMADEAKKEADADLKDALDAEARAKKAIEGRLELARKDAQLSAQNKIAAVDSAVSNLQNNPLALNETKRRGLIDAYTDQNKAIKQRIELLNQERAMGTTSDTRRGQIDSEVSSLNSKTDGNNAAILNAQAKTVGAGATEGAVAYLNSIPDAAGRASNAIQSVAQGLENGIGSSLDGLIRRTMTWGQALANIGQSIVDSIIGAFVKMAAQWITQQIVMAIFGNAIRDAQLAAMLPVTAEMTEMWLPAATAASIATVGGAAVEGATSAKMAILASATGLAEGGPVRGPGTGKSDDIPVWLSNGEYVMPAAETAKYRPMLDAMRAGTLSKDELASSPVFAGGGKGGSAPAVNNSVNMAFFDSRPSAEQWAKSQEGETHYVDIAQRNIHKITGQG